MVPLNEELERHVHIKAGSITLFVCHKIQAPGSTKAGLTGTENMNQNAMNNWGYSFCFLMARRGPLSMHLSTKSASTIFFSGWEANFTQKAFLSWFSYHISIEFIEDMDKHS